MLFLFGAERVAARVGADVPFLCSGHDFALVSGIGDHIEPVKANEIHGVIAIPNWETETKAAYSELDAMGYDMGIMLARTEARDIYHANAGRKVGLLPNDFTKVLLKDHPKYNELFRMFQKADADCWGVTGSGSAAFAVLSKPTPLKWPEYVKHVLFF